MKRCEAAKVRVCCKWFRVSENVGINMLWKDNLEYFLFIRFKKWSTFSSFQWSTSFILKWCFFFGIQNSHYLLRIKNISFYWLKFENAFLVSISRFLCFWTSQARISIDNKKIYLKRLPKANAISQSFTKYIINHFQTFTSHLTAKRFQTSNEWIHISKSLYISKSHFLSPNCRSNCSLTHYLSCLFSWVIAARLDQSMPISSLAKLAWLFNYVMFRF